MALPGKMQIHTHNNGTVKLTFTAMEQKNPNMKHITQKQPKPKIIRTCHYSCACVRLMAVLIIFPVILQTVVNLVMLSIVGQGTIFSGRAQRIWWL